MWSSSIEWFWHWIGTKIDGNIVNMFLLLQQTTNNSIFPERKTVMWRLRYQRRWRRTALKNTKARIVFFSSLRNHRCFFKLLGFTVLFWIKIYKMPDLVWILFLSFENTHSLIIVCFCKVGNDWTVSVRQHSTDESRLQISIFYLFIFIVFQFLGVVKFCDATGASTGETISISNYSLFSIYFPPKW